MTRGSSERRSRTGAADHSGSLAPALRRRLGRPAWLARAAAVALCLVSLACVGLIVGGFATAGQLAVVTQPLPLRVGLALVPVVVVLAAGTVAGTLLAWYNGYWSRAARVHQTLLAVLGLVFVWQLFALGFLP